VRQPGLPDAIPPTQPADHDERTAAASLEAGADRTRDDVAPFLVVVFVAPGPFAHAQVDGARRSVLQPGAVAEPVAAAAAATSRREDLVSGGRPSEPGRAPELDRADVLCDADVVGVSCSPLHRRTDD